MRAETYKSRFVKPGTKIEVEIPYSTGLSKTTGLIDRWLDDGVIQKDGYGFLVEVNGKQIKFKKQDLTDEFALEVIKTNPICQKIEKEFEQFESEDLFSGEDESDSGLPSSDRVEFNLNPGEKIDVETGEIISTETPEGFVNVSEG
jgi:hypothetical protein